MEQLKEDLLEEIWDIKPEDIESELQRMEKREAERQRRRAIRRRKRRMAIYTFRFLVCMGVMLIILVVVLIVKKTAPAVSNYVENNVEEWKESREDKPLKIWTRPEFTVDLLTPNEYSRPQEALGTVKNIFVHYTANPGTSAAQNRSYFENLGITGERSASAHFVIGYEGEVIQCIPLSEIGYAVMQHNYNSVSIECCYLDEDGKFTQETYDSLIEMLAWLISKYDLTSEDILRHYDAGGKLCPKYYAEHEDAWEKLKKDVDTYIQENGTRKDPAETEEEQGQ